MPREKWEEKKVKRDRKTNLPLTISPKINAHPDGIVQRRVRALVDQDRGKDEQRQHHQSRRDASVDGRPGYDAQGQFPREHEDPEDHVDYLQDGGGLDGVVEVLGPHVEEDFGPEDAVEAGCELA